MTTAQDLAASRLRALQAYVCVWSETQAAARQSALATCWTEASEIVGPGYRFVGREQVQAEIERFQREQPQHRVGATSGFDLHGRWARFTIGMFDRQGRLLAEGWDIVEFDDDDRIRRVLTFWGSLPATPPKEG